MTQPYQWRPLTDEDVQSWSALTHVLATVDDTEEIYQPEDLLEELHEAGVDPELDTLGVWCDGALIGFGQLRVREGLNEGRAVAWIGGGVHPGHRGRGIGTGLLDRLEARARELAAHRHPGTELKASVGGGLESDPVRPLLTERGYELVRYFTLMERSLPAGDLPAPARPVLQYSADWAEPLRVAHNEAFADHYGSVPASPAEWADGLAMRAYRPELSFLAADESATVLGYTMTYCYLPEELYVGRVGTVRRARSQGFARSCLIAALHAASEQGYTIAKLDVDSVNPTGAGALYESVGFRPVKQFATFAQVFPSL